MNKYKQKILSQGYVKKSISLGVYPIKVQLVIALDLDKANSYFMHRYYPDGDVYTHVTKRTGLCRNTGDEIAILLPCDANTEVITHECLHAICFLLDIHGVNYGDPKNTEILCYPIGYLCRAVFNEMHKWRTKR